MIYIFYIVSYLIIFFISAEVDSNKVSLTQYAIMFIIVAITLCIHMVLSISRRNREQIFWGFCYFVYIIPMSIFIIYFFLIKPNEILSSFVYFSIVFLIVAITHFYIYMGSIGFRYGYIIDIIFGIISAAIGNFYYDRVIKRANVRYKVMNVNGDIGEQIRAIFESDDILSLEKYIFICVVVFFIIFIYKKICIYIYDRLYNNMIDYIINCRRNL